MATRKTRTETKRRKELPAGQIDTYYDKPIDPNANPDAYCDLWLSLLAGVRALRRKSIRALDRVRPGLNGLTEEQNEDLFLEAHNADRQSLFLRDEYRRMARSIAIRDRKGRR